MPVNLYKENDVLPHGREFVVYGNFLCWGWLDCHYQKDISSLKKRAIKRVQ